jgi:regulator of protease activity HflC (stomatin/prohibitin superfamily)
MDNGQSAFRFVTWMSVFLGGFTLAHKLFGWPLAQEEPDRFGGTGLVPLVPTEGWWKFLLLMFLTIIVANTIAGMIYVLPQWNRAVILRLGTFVRTAGPGLYILPPFFYEVTQIVDLRTMTEPLTAQQTLTRDQVQLDVEAVLFYRVNSDTPENAVLEVEDFVNATLEAAHVVLRSTIGEHTFEELLGSREKIGDHIRDTIEKQATSWGIDVDQVSLKDIRIPAGLLQAMSRKAQADQERLARVTLARAEEESAQSMVRAAETYAENPTALELRRMNIAYEGMTSGNPTLMVIPTTSLDSLGGMASTLAYQQMANGRKNPVESPATTVDPESTWPDEPAGK